MGVIDVCHLYVNSLVACNSLSVGSGGWKVNQRVLYMTHIYIYSWYIVDICSRIIILLCTAIQWSAGYSPKGRPHLLKLLCMANGKKHQSYDDFNTTSMRVAETNHDFLPSALGTLAVNVRPWIFFANLPPIKPAVSVEVVFCSILKRPGWRMMDGCGFLVGTFPCRKSPNPQTHQSMGPNPQKSKVPNYYSGVDSNISNKYMDKKHLPKGGLLYGIIYIYIMLQFIGPSSTKTLKPN